MKKEILLTVFLVFNLHSASDEFIDAIATSNNNRDAIREAVSKEFIRAVKTGDKDKMDTLAVQYLDYISPFLLSKLWVTLTALSESDEQFGYVKDYLHKKIRVVKRVDSDALDKEGETMIKEMTTLRLLLKNKYFTPETLADSARCEMAKRELAEGW